MAERAEGPHTERIYRHSRHVGTGEHPCDESGHAVEMEIRSDGTVGNAGGELQGPSPLMMPLVAEWMRAVLPTVRVPTLSSSTGPPIDPIVRPEWGGRRRRSHTGRGNTSELLGATSTTFYGT